MSDKLSNWQIERLSNNIDKCHICISCLNEWQVKSKLKYFAVSHLSSLIAHTVVIKKNNFTPLNEDEVFVISKIVNIFNKDNVVIITLHECCPYGPALQQSTSFCLFYLKYCTDIISYYNSCVH